MISVIVCTYNQEQYIKQTIDSILSQQVDEPIEIIIGDDHSTDGTSAIGAAYQLRYPDTVRYFYNTPNLGLVKNFIAMLRHCRGQYIALCDGDDYWIDPLKLQHQVDVLRQDAQCVLVHTNRCLLADKVYEQSPLDEAIAENPSELLFHTYICEPTVMFRAETAMSWLDSYERLSQEQDWRMQDYPMWLYLGLHGTFHYIPENTAMYRVLPNTLSRIQDKQKQYLFDCSVLRVKETFYPQYYAQATNKTQFRRRYKEMEFHSRKRMVLNYGRLARKQVLYLLKLIPYFPMIVWRKIKRG